MHNFVPGQRWICNADLQLGLGSVLTVEHRMVNISFVAADEVRCYAKQSAPLTRVVFSVGDTLISEDGKKLTVESVEQQDDLLSYSGTDADGNELTLKEQQLSNSIQFYHPAERLFNGDIDNNNWFQVRYQSLLEYNRLAKITIHGLIGCRTSLIPHQLYIANEVAHRYAPRVLLADEVGLGKTIEAGLILHHQLITERAQRILIIVPETLVHQWLVEMLRRFNLHFSVFDEDRCEALIQSDAEENPFHSEQLILCSLNFLKQNPNHLQSSLAGEWDLLVVDEAHHLEWSPQLASPEYSIVEQLSACTKGVLLLTATPEQLGKAGHFARLRLLDPDRFDDFNSFVEEERSYVPIAQSMEALLGEKALDDKTTQMMASAIQEEDTQRLLACVKNSAIDSEENHHARTTLIESLLDRHGTGRVLFRNTRATIKGFPVRKAHAIPLPLPQLYSDCLAAFEIMNLSEPQLLLCPELLVQASAVPEDPDWTEIDPRIVWLIDTLKQLRPAKVLLITASSQTALDVALAIKEQTGQHVPVFHEQMSLIARDRAAAFFADSDGSQLLICSEIGSEGRNFQFAHHLVLFDLPWNPDLLEQRIGRLDRIGQTEAIKIHIPYLENSAQEVMFHWYQQGLNAFEQTCPAGQAVFLKVNSMLKDALHQGAASQDEFSNLIELTQSTNQNLNETLHQGRDKLLEYNSCRPAIAEQLMQQAIMQDKDSSLASFMDAIFDCFGVQTEEHRAGSIIIRSSEHMTAPFPGLSEEGMIITYDRQVALANEDIHFLTWTHPLVSNALDRVFSSEFGNATVTAIQSELANPGSLFLESLYLLETTGNNIQQSNRYLPPTMIRILIDEHGKSHYPYFEHKVINKQQLPVTNEIARQVIQLKKPLIQQLVAASKELAQAQVPELIQQAHKQTNETFSQEIERLKALRKVNPNVREEEIVFLERQHDNLAKLFDSANLRLDAIRVIVAT